MREVDRENSVIIFLEKSFCGRRISMSGSVTKALCSKSAFGDKPVCKKKILAKFNTFLKKLHRSSLKNKEFFCILQNISMNNKVRQAGLAHFWLQKDWAAPDRVCQYLLTAVKLCSFCYSTEQRLKGEGEPWICQYVPRKQVCKL